MKADFNIERGVAMLNREITLFRCIEKTVGVWVLLGLWLGGIATLSLAQSSPVAIHYEWKSVTIGAGGFVPGIIFSPLEKDLVYLRSDMGGCYRWDQALSKWLPLNDGMAESSYHGAESLAVDPIDPNVVYVAAGMYRSDPAAMLRSQDRGNTWEVYPVKFKMGGNEDGRGLGERLAIDPNDNQILYFGSRHDGLLCSRDRAKTWQNVAGFPLAGGGQAGLSFVAFDGTSGNRGAGSKVIYVGSADPGKQHLFKTSDGGASWSAVPGGPDQNMLPIQGKLDSQGLLYITYGDGVGPNGVKAGCVFVLNTTTAQWNNITPDKSNSASGGYAGGGYAGLSLDLQKPGTLAVSTFNRWAPTDTIWRTTDGGKSWLDIAARYQVDVSATPFLSFGKPKPRLGWWIAAVAIDPFDSNHSVYATGATVYACSDFANVSSEQPTHWKPWVSGIEQTATLALASPPEGPHLLSGLGDVGGFAHDDLDVSPPQGMFAHPIFTNTDSIDYAGMKPNMVVRAGRGKEAACAYSEDFGHNWQPLSLPTSTDRTDNQQRQRTRQREQAITITADGKKIILSGSDKKISADLGKTWLTPVGLPNDARIVVDRVNPQLCYAMDFKDGQLFVSDDGGSNFSARSKLSLPKVDDPGRVVVAIKAATGKQGDLWAFGPTGLYHSTDAGASFSKVNTRLIVKLLAFGKAAPGHDNPELFAVGTLDHLTAIWRSDDSGQSWLRVNDDAHQYGLRFRCIEGDPRVFGRVYLGTDGRGILYGQPVNNP